LLEIQQTDRPLVIVAGNISWPPDRYLVPAIYRDTKKKSCTSDDFNWYIFIWFDNLDGNTLFIY
jgi:hypothetical protein